MSRSEEGKVYEGVLHQLKSYIGNNGLRTGDKLPSERELSELLNVGRSSIREALRAMELLGLIETRRGEGTFMRAYRPYHMVELLSNFLLNESRTREELLTAKQMLEKEVMLLLTGDLSTEQLGEVTRIIKEQVKSIRHESLFEYLFQQCDQHLLSSMWQFISGFTHTVHSVSYEEWWYEQVIDTLESGDSLKVLHLFNQ